MYGLNESVIVTSCYFVDVGDNEKMFRSETYQLEHDRPFNQF